MSMLNGTTPMQSLLLDFPGSKRALFAKYHIGGCSSCAYGNEETLASVCQRNEIDLEEAIAHILESHEHDREMILSATELAERLKSSSTRLLDTRTREEHEAVSISGSEFLTQELQQKIFGEADQDTHITLYDHQGDKALDTCAWFRGHGLKNTYILEGGIDGYSQIVDSSIPRYRMEIE